MCEEYARKWRFTYNPAKTQYIAFAPSRIQVHVPPVRLAGATVQAVDEVELLGCVFSASGSATANAQRRIDKCRKTYFQHRARGLSFPGLNPMCKIHVWSTSCQPILTYGLAALSYTRKDIASLDKAQAGFIKMFMGLPKTCRHSKLMQALNIRSIDVLQKRAIVSLFYRNVCVDSLALQITLFLIDLFLKYNIVIPGSLLERLLSHNEHPLHVIAKCGRVFNCNACGISDGLIDSIRFIVFNTNLFPGSPEQSILFNLTRSF